MNVNVEALNKAMTLSKSRRIAPQHYAQAAGLDWYTARKALRELAERNFLKAGRDGRFLVLDFSVDD